MCTDRSGSARAVSSANARATWLREKSPSFLISAYFIVILDLEEIFSFSPYITALSEYATHAKT